MEVPKDGGLGDSIMLDHVVTPQLQASTLGGAEACAFGKPKDDAEDDAAGGDVAAAGETGEGGVEGDSGEDEKDWGDLTEAMNMTRGKWSTDEKKWLWECYVSVGRNGKRDGYQEKVFRMYCDKKCFPLRSKQAVMQAVRTIDNGGLTEMEKADILQRVMDEQMRLFGVGQIGMDSGDQTSPEFIGELKGFDGLCRYEDDVWIQDDDVELDDDIDFDVAAVSDDEGDDSGRQPKWSTPLTQPKNQTKIHIKGCAVGSIPRRSSSQGDDGDDRTEGRQAFVHDG